MSAGAANTPSTPAPGTPVEDPGVGMVGPGEAGATSLGDPTETVPVYPGSDAINDLGFDVPEAPPAAPPAEPPATPDAPPATPPANAAATPPEGTPTEKPKDLGEATYEARYKNVQAWATKLSQENKELQAKLTAAGGTQQTPGQSPDAPPAADQEPVMIDGKPFSYETYNEIAEDEGREKAMEYAFAYQREEARRAALSAVQQEREAAELQMREQRIAQEAQQLFQSFGVDDAAFSQMEQLRDYEVQQGFNPSPGALLVQQMAGNYENAAKLIQLGLQAAAGQITPPAPAPAPAPLVPTGFAGGAGPQAPTGHVGSPNPADYFSPQDIGL